MDLCNLKELRPLLERHGFRFSKAMGQNFLIAPWVPRRVAEESGADKSCGVLEIGPGVGCLTKELSAVAGRVTAVELDRRLIPVLKESLADCENVEVINGDILAENIDELTEKCFNGLKPVVCANLPYNITTPILTRLIECGRFKTITVMVQREVAKRMCAKAGSAEYGAFSVFVNFYTKPEMLFDVEPDCFVPQPKVTSSVIKLVTRETPPPEVRDSELFFRVVRASFNQRRKTLANALAASFGSDLQKETLSDIIRACGYDDRIRGEILDIAGFAKIAAAIGDSLQ